MTRLAGVLAVGFGVTALSLAGACSDSQSGPGGQDTSVGVEVGGGDNGSVGEDTGAAPDAERDAEQDVGADAGPPGDTVADGEDGQVQDAAADGEPSDGSLGDGADGQQADVLPGDVAGDGGLADAPLTDAGAGDVGKDYGGPLTSDVDVWVDTGPAAAGDFLAPCETSEDCYSGWCVPSPQGKVCSKSCLESCPAPGWSCRGVTAPSGDPAFICVSALATLCLPCEANKDCNLNVSNAPNLCLDAGKEGSFCGVNCGQAGTLCPPGYTCEEIYEAPANARWQCRPAGGALCTCNAWGPESGLSTKCKVWNEYGACSGTRTCGSDGLTDCAGQVPAPETCNNVDDNCDGNVDEGVVGGDCEISNEFGTCPGAYACVAGADGECLGMTPTAEVCDGVDNDCDGETDEGFVDTDGDGQADCADLDDDDDGAPDSVDCAPLDPAIHPGATEVCDGGVDNNCDGQGDEDGAEGCSDFWRDADGDGYGSAALGPRCLCGPDAVPYYNVTNGEDCNDVSAQAKPGGVEVCDGLDDDCNGSIDDGFVESPCVITNAIGSCNGTRKCVAGTEMCVGQTPTAEVCNGVDDDCNGQTDEGFQDTDGDGIPDCAEDDDDNDGFADMDDCQPLNGNAYPGAQEVCDGTDTDCDGQIDEEDAEGCSPYYQDADDDGYGNEATSRCLCGPDPFTYYNTTTGGDCNDIDAAVHPDAAETCNYVDDDCDGQTDEGVASPCGSCEPVCVLDVGEDADAEYQLTPDNSSGLTPDANGGLTLDSATFEIPFLWIANSAEDTVSKLNTENGCEVARYAACDNPSRTAVDLYGNGIISCRNDGRVAKVAEFEVDCVDKNGNGQIDTSRDLDGNCQIDASEMVPNDECILWNVAPDGVGGCNDSTQGCARAAGVDADNNVWVGFWSSYHLTKLNGLTGETMVTHTLTGRPYGLAIDADGQIWVASRSPHELIQADPVDGQLGHWAAPAGRVYGMAIDPLGKIWVASGESGGVQRFDPGTGTWDQVYDDFGNGYSRGVAISVTRDAGGNIIDSKVFVAHHTWSGGCTSNGTHRYIDVIDALTDQVEAPIDLGADRAPVGVGVDANNMLWTVNQCESSATRVDTTTKQVLGNYPVGQGPYTYSDMTGYALRTITSPNGYYRQTFTGWLGSQTLWDKLIVDATLPGDGITKVQVRWRTGDTEAELGGAAWNGPFGPYPPLLFPLDIKATANYLEVEVSLLTDDPNVIPTLHTVSVVAYQQNP